MAAMVLMGGVIMGVILTLWKKPVKDEDEVGGIDIEGAADVEITLENL